jgi:hypothetical protein
MCTQIMCTQIMCIYQLISPMEENDAVALENLNDDEIMTYVITNREMEESNMLSDNEQEVKAQSVMSAKDVLTAIENLERFMELENGQEFRDAEHSLTRVKRRLRERMEKSQTQTVITSFFDTI